jgi:hypothetical protein
MMDALISMSQSARESQSAYQIAQSDVPGAIPYLREALDVSYLHLSEMENGISPRAALNPGSHFDTPENSRLAIRYFLSFLQRATEDLQVRWLEGSLT